MPEEQLLKIYLNDHLAGSMGGLELARRCRSSNEGTPLADFLDELIASIESERGLLEDLLRQVGGTPSIAKQTAVWALEKVGRLKLNGKIIGYSDLSRLIELETLLIGVTGKLSLWRSLKTVQTHVPALKDPGFDELIKRAEDAVEKLSRFSDQAAEQAFVRR